MFGCGGEYNNKDEDISTYKQITVIPHFKNSAKNILNYLNLKDFNPLSLDLIAANFNFIFN